MMRSLRQPLFALAFVGTVVAVPALAQQPVTYPAPCDASKVSKSDVDRAHSVYLIGKQFLEESNYDKAIGYFNDAYSIDCSVHAILPIIATAYERRGDKGEAIRALEEYLRRAPDAPDREHVERRIKNLNDQLTREQPSSAPPAPTAPTPTSSAPISTTPSAAPTEPPALSASPGPSAPASQDAASNASSGPGPWIMAGIGGAAVVAGVILFAVGANNISSAQSACGDSRHNCTQSVASKGNTGISLETAGVTAGAVGVAAIAGGLIWHFAIRPSAATTGAFISPLVAPGFAGVALSGELPGGGRREHRYPFQ